MTVLRPFDAVLVAARIQSAYMWGVGWKVPALWATGAVIGLAVAGAAVGLAVHGTAGALLGVVPGALAGVVAGFVPAFRDRAREERERTAAARRAWEEVGEPAVGDRGLSPAGLLRPDRAVVEFTGRDAELGELLAWCSSDVQRSVRVLVGAGGTGKTRLALQVASEWQAAGHAWRLVGAGAEGIALQAARGVTASPVCWWWITRRRARIWQDSCGPCWKILGR